MKIWGIVIMLLLLCVIGILVTKNHPMMKTLTTNMPKLALDSLPDPIKKMTVPYLRSRTYESQLGDMQVYEEHENYTSYLTSYTSDGLKVNGLLTIPKDGTGTIETKGTRKYPAIVFVHGYIDPQEYVTTERYIAYVDYLARNGFVVFKIDLRGNGQSQGTPGGGYYGSDYVVDTLHAYSALANAKFVNPKDIGLWGHSMAGNIVLRSMAAQPTIPAAVIWAGAVYSYVDQVKYGIHDLSYHPPSFTSRQNNSRTLLFEKIGSPSATSPVWKLIAPTNYLSDLKGAIEIHHAEDDDTVNVGYSRDLIALLDKTSVPHEFFTYPSGGHNISAPSFDLAMQRSVEFFKKYLNN
jgi:fermentation-respiration switch protein FrsA (DUF1100 family)